MQTREVNNMNERIAQVRKSNKINQDEFAKRLGLTKNFISLIETGGRIPSERTILDICREFNVNEYWLRTGEGEMFRERSRAEDLAGLLASMCENPTPFQKSLIAVLAKLDPSQWKLLEEKAMELFEEMQKEKASQQDC
jgi:transcriptional regulator with XRE-family HTH domain